MSNLEKFNAIFDLRYKNLCSVSDEFEKKYEKESGEGIYPWKFWYGHWNDFSNWKIICQWFSFSSRLYSRLYVVFRISSLLLFVNNYPSKSIYLLSNMLYDDYLSSMLLWTFHLWFISHEWKFSPKILSLSKRRSPLS